MIPLSLVALSLVAQHLGPLHPVEQALTLLLAFGPFVLLGFTIWVSRRRNSRDHRPEADVADRAERTGGAKRGRAALPCRRPTGDREP